MTTTFQKTSGAILSVSAAVPTTYDNNVTTGYPSLTWTDLVDAEIMDFSGFETVWDTEEDDTWKLDDAAPTKTRKKLGQPSLTLKYNKDNTAFHAIIEAAEDSATDVISVQVTHANGTDYRWFTAQVIANNDKYGGGDQSLTTEIVFLQQTSVVRDNA